ncbi:hypothetical protein [Pediococcus acidilactici]|uniref:hypothetical protein n=1 Tax=Pediococcus acidilactici TaxID=1254 RepID=UPI0006832FC7|nr:hypothetical protein [Pediococcus acidilactici]
MANTTEVVQGNSLKMFYRRLSWAKNREAELVPYQTSVKLSFKRDSDSKKLRTEIFRLARVWKLNWN